MTAFMMFCRWLLVVAALCLTLAAAERSSAASPRSYPYKPYYRPHRPYRPYRPYRPNRPYRPYRPHGRPGRPSRPGPHRPGPNPDQKPPGKPYFSWRDQRLPAQGALNWHDAFRHCVNRRQQLVSIETAEKNKDIVELIEKDNVPFIWTSGRRDNGGFVWVTGKPVKPINWAETGGEGKPQPDNREGDEDCLAVLRYFYPDDGITWHDIACHHPKPFICE